MAWSSHALYFRKTPIKLVCIYLTQVAKLLLDYMYTGYLGVNMNVVGELISTAEKLGMQDVIQCCNMHLANNLNVDLWAQV